MREPFDGESRDGSGDIAKRPTRNPVPRPPSERRNVPPVIRVPVEALRSRDRSARVTSPADSSPASLAPQEIAIPRPSRMSSVFAFFGFVLGLAVALTWVEWMHRASLTAMRDAAMLRDPSRP